MNKIKFSHRYEKMPFSDDPRDTILLEVLTVEKKLLSKDFIEYDTCYFERFGNDLVKSNYPLPDGKVLILILNSYSVFKNNLWTTIRRWTPEKEAYYRSIRGQQVEIEV